MEGKTQETAAAMSGMSVRSARKWQSGPLPSATKRVHWWRTRSDPFDGVWEEEISPCCGTTPRRIASIKRLLNYGRAGSPGRCSHKFGDS